MVFLPNLSVNRRACLCGVVNYASAQTLDFLDLGQKSSFLDWKHQMVPFFGDDLLWTGTNYLSNNCVFKWWMAFSRRGYN
jgi:hypothetical protein